MKTKCLYIILMALLSGCGTKKNQRVDNTNKGQQDTIVTSVAKHERVFADTVLQLKYKDDTVKVLLKFASHQASSKNLLLLNGWDLPATDWCDSLNFCAMATGEGYNIISPDMGLSVYSSNHYPETYEKWKKYPTRPWLHEKMIPFLQKNYGILLPGQENYIIGISTGARGAALLAADDKGALFSGIALLSGDFDQTLDTTDNLMKHTYGSYDKYSHRWHTVDNVHHVIENIECDVFIAHGEKDQIVNPGYSITLHDTLAKVNKKHEISFSIVPGAGHDYSFWESQLEAVLEFFSRVK